MYWADWSRNRPKIEVANMDGTDRRVLVKYPLSLPNGLTLVHSTNELCYSDAGMWAILCVNLGDLSMRKAYNPTTYPFGITSFNRTLFWTDWTLGRIQRMGMNSKIPDKPLRSFVGSNGKIFDIKAVQPCGRTGGKDWVIKVTRACTSWFERWPFFRAILFWQIPYIRLNCQWLML